MADRNEEINALVEDMRGNAGKVREAASRLEEAPRRERQIVASALHELAKTEPELLVEQIPALIDAMNRPEAQTRWECLETLALLVPHDSRSCSKAMPEAEAALFDEDSGPVRLAAMRFLCKLGATTAARSEKAWPLIDEGIQCYHGDLEFGDMLTAITEFSNGKLSDSVRAEFIDRMTFDATNGKGSIKRRAQVIIENLK